MNRLYLKDYRRTLLSIPSGLFLFALAVLLIQELEPVSAAVGYLIGLLTVLLHLLLIMLTLGLPQHEFLPRFYLGTLLRILLVLSLFTFLFVATNLEQNSFTLSFIISYIFHSVIDVILIHKTLAKRSSINS